MATFAAAAVITREYPGLLTDLLAYGTAGTVASMRVLGEQHSPSDVVVGSMIGYLIGRYVYAAHHNPELPGESIGTVVKDQSRESGGSKFVASPYVPMDSYVYPLLDRLIATGAVNSGILGQRPWTRAECARLVQEGTGAREGRIGRFDGLLTCCDGSSHAILRTLRGLRRRFRSMNSTRAPRSSAERL